jgi:hypothetical protein
VREPRYLVELEKAMRACGIEDEKLIRQTKLQAQVKHDLRERESGRWYKEWLSKRAPMPPRMPTMHPMGRVGETKYPCFVCLFKLGFSKQEVMRRLKIGSSIYNSWFDWMRQPKPILITSDNYHLVFPDQPRKAK